jgi:PIN domain nuclease of toxin-antitoxin system
MSLAKWSEIALPTHWVRVLEITPGIVIDATRLPAWGHKDPGAQIAVATAGLHGLKVLPSDSQILKYPHVGSVARLENG